MKPLKRHHAQFVKAVCEKHALVAIYNRSMGAWLIQPKGGSYIFLQMKHGTWRVGRSIKGSWVEDLVALQLQLEDAVRMGAEYLRARDATFRLTGSSIYGSLPRRTDMEATNDDWSSD